MTHRWAMRPLFGDTDAMGVVYHGTYLRYFERGRAELMRQAGQAYTALMDLGLHLPVSEAWIKYHQPARYDDDLVIETTVAWIKKASMRFEYRLLRRGDGGETLLVSGATVHACVDGDGRVKRLPDWLAAMAKQVGE